MIPNSCILSESTETIFICKNKTDTIEIFIRPYENYFLEYPYVLIMINRYGKPIYDLDTQFCRLSMFEPRYLAYEDEDLVLKLHELVEVKNMLSENWKNIISLFRLTLEDPDDKENLYNLKYIEFIFPDYDKLINKDIDIQEYMEKRAINKRINNISTYLEFKYIYENRKDSIIMIYRDKDYDIFFNWDNCSYIIINRNDQLDSCIEISYPDQYIYNRKINTSYNNHSDLLDKDFKPKLPIRYSINEIMAILHAIINNIPYEQIILPNISE